MWEVIVGTSVYMNRGVKTIASEGVVGFENF